jgi:nucleotide-binding universal stress UspA family protein
MPDLQLARYRERAHDEGIALVDEVLEGVDVPNGVAVQRVINAGSPAAVLLSEARPERLLVVGTRGHGALGRMVFGSVSHQCLHHATGPVVVVPERGVGLVGPTALICSTVGLTSLDDPRRRWSCVHWSC